MIERPCTAMINSIVDWLDIDVHSWVEVNILSGGWVIVARDLDD